MLRILLLFFFLVRRVRTLCGVRLGAVVSVVTRKRRESATEEIREHKESPYKRERAREWVRVCACVCVRDLLQTAASCSFSSPGCSSYDSCASLATSNCFFGFRFGFELPCFVVLCCAARVCGKKCNKYVCPLAGNVLALVIGGSCFCFAFKSNQQWNRCVDAWKPIKK